MLSFQVEFRQSNVYFLFIAFDFTFNLKILLSIFFLQVSKLIEKHRKSCILVIRIKNKIYTVAAQLSLLVLRFGYMNDD